MVDNDQLFEFNDNIILKGDVFASLKFMKDNNIIVSCAITSPPYWGQRDYNIEGQIGNEADPDIYIAKLVKIFDLLKDILTDDGVFFLNIGDKYEIKYGNSSKLMIPYRLAYFMKLSGWIINDVIVWYKPNHMPSGVKNRLTNTYESILVCVKQKNNFYQKYLSKNEFNKVIKVSLSASKNSHVAPYPEKLIIELLKLGVPDTGIILDPFSGSGTTTSAVNQFFNLSGNNSIRDTTDVKMRTIDIEINDEFLRINKDRNNINKILIIDYIEYDFDLNDMKSHISSMMKNFEQSIDKMLLSETQITKINDIVNHINLQMDDHIMDTLATMNSESAELLVEDDNIIMISVNQYDTDLFYYMWLFRGFKWVIRNIIVCANDTNWSPIFLLVRDVKSCNYYFNIDKIRIRPQGEMTRGYPDNIIGVRVKKPSTFFITADEGIIVDTYESDNMGSWGIVRWSNGSIEYFRLMHDNQKFIPVFSCSVCDNLLDRYYHYSRELRCEVCNSILWTKNSCNIQIKNMRGDTSIRSKLENYITSNDYSDIQHNHNKIDYDGKYKNMKKINIGQSPGARSMMNEEFITLDRLYRVNQSLVADYFNIIRKNRKITKKSIVNTFNNIRQNYTHTIGHWFRKDKGGSLPKYEDILELSKILDISSEFMQLLNTYSLKLVNVALNRKGKNPGDYFEQSVTEVIDFIAKVGEY